MLPHLERNPTFYNLPNRTFRSAMTNMVYCCSAQYSSHWQHVATKHMNEASVTKQPHFLLYLISTCG